LGVFRY